MSRAAENYPVYRIWWQSGEKAGKRHTKHKKSFLIAIQRLENKKQPFKCWFAIEYNAEDKNESIEYTDWQLALKDARIFSMKSEVDQWL